MNKKQGDPFINHIEELYSVHKTYDYYRILCINRNDPVEKIKKAFFNAELKYHPDMHLLIDDDIEKKLVEIFTYINNAYMTLTDPKKRLEYDRCMENNGRDVTLSNIRPRSCPVQDEAQQNKTTAGSVSSDKVFVDSSDKAKLKFRDGKVAFWDNDFSKAARLFEMAKELDCSVAEYHFMYGCTLGKLGKNKDAVRALNRANELKPSDPDTLTELGHLYLKLAFPLRAVGYFRQALKIEPSNKRAREGINMAG